VNHSDPNPRPVTRPAALALAAALALTLAACGGGPSGAGDTTTTGTLDVAITGLPAGTPGDVAVSGPAGFADALTVSEVLTDLAVGSYAVAADPVDAPTPAGATYDPVVPSQSAAVVADTTTDVAVEYDLHECVAYEPSVGVGGDLSGRWQQPGNAGTLIGQISVPADRGGGYVTVNMATPANVVPGLRVQVLPEQTGEGDIFNGGAGNSDVTNALQFVFEVGPSSEFELALTANSFTGGTSAEVFPVDFTASWSFTSRVDCYEPNDTFDDAKAIPMENAITASFIAGYRDSNSIGATSEPTLDFYRFELHEATAVRITLSDVADTARPRLVLYNAGGSQVGGGALAPAAGEDAVYESGGPLAAGWYRVRVDTGLSPSDFARKAHTSEGDPMPAQLTQDYTLIVDALD